MKILTIIFLFFLAQFSSYGQGENNVWAFGYRLKLDFNTVGGPSFFSSSSNTSEGCASVSDAGGNLVFYCDGSTVYDRTNIAMPNGSGMMGHSSTTQGVAIAKVRGDDSLYFVFTLMPILSSGILSYSIVNMKLNGGLGDVVSSQKNIPLGTGFSEKMVIAGSCGKQWLIVHHRDSANFYAFELGIGAGISSPIISTFSIVSSVGGYNTSGEMKVSSDFKKIALTNGASVYDFNSNTGKVTNRVFLSLDSPYFYGIEFSPDGSKLYCSRTGLIQYDLSAGTISDIIASKTLLFSASTVSGLRLGPDGMLYFKSMSPATGIANNFDRIRLPNLAGTASDIQPNFFSPALGSHLFSNGFGNQFVSLKEIEDSTFSIISSLFCNGATYEIAGRSTANNYKWSNGASTEKISVSRAGKYWVSSIIDCKLYIDTFHFIGKVNEETIIKTDTIICFKDSAKLSAIAGYTGYLWGNGSTQKDTIVYNDCNVFMRAIDTINCRILTQSFNAQFVKFKLELKDTFICSLEPITLDATITAPDARYLWSTTDTTAQTIVSQSGIYAVLVTGLGCSQNRYLNVAVGKLAVSIGNDRYVCEGEESVLESDAINAEYLWSTGETSPFIKVSKTGTYSLVVTKNGWKGTASALISFVTCDNCIAFPNIFSPNGDGINDYFSPILNCPPKLFELKIFNRWGQEIFMSKSPNDRWDGTFRGRELNTGVYFYMLKITFEGQSDEVQMFKGDIAIVR